MRMRKRKTGEIPAEKFDAETAPDDTTVEDNTTADEFPDISAGLAILSKYQAMTGPRPVMHKANKRGTWSDFD